MIFAWLSQFLKWTYKIRKPKEFDRIDIVPSLCFQSMLCHCIICHVMTKIVLREIKLAKTMPQQQKSHNGCIIRKKWCVKCFFPPFARIWNVREGYNDLWLNQKNFACWQAWRGIFIRNFYFNLDRVTWAVIKNVSRCQIRLKIIFVNTSSATATAAECCIPEPTCHT